MGDDDDGEASAPPFLYMRPYLNIRGTSPFGKKICHNLLGNFSATNPHPRSLVCINPSTLSGNIFSSFGRPQLGKVKQEAVVSLLARMLVSNFKPAPNYSKEDSNE